MCADCWHTIRSVTLPTQYNHLYQIIMLSHYTMRTDVLEALCVLG
jgi:hypothetical protein